MKSINLIPENLRDRELYIKLCDLIDYELDKAKLDFNDVENKYREPDKLSNDAIAEVIHDLGFTYIEDIIKTISNVEFKLLSEFSGLINILKGTRGGLELILTLLGFEYFIKEWWEEDFSGKKEPHSFDFILCMNPNYVKDAKKTFEKVMNFISNYVYPKVRHRDYHYGKTIGRKYIAMGGFVRHYYSGVIKKWQ